MQFRFHDLQYKTNQNYELIKTILGPIHTYVGDDVIQKLNSTITCNKRKFIIYIFPCFINIFLYIFSEKLKHVNIISDKTALPEIQKITPRFVCGLIHIFDKMTFTNE